jgi:hypothetical protein
LRSAIIPSAILWLAYAGFCPFTRLSQSILSAFFEAAGIFPHTRGLLSAESIMFPRALFLSIISGVRFTIP